MKNRGFLAALGLTGACTSDDSINPDAIDELITGLAELPSEPQRRIDDSFGVVEDVAPFESGWRRTLQLHRSSSGQQITLQVSLTPVP
jgi:hypothetical protein